MTRLWIILAVLAVSICGSVADAQLKGTASIPVSIRWVSGTNDTLLTTDCFNYVHYSASTPVTVTVPNGLGTVCDIVLIQDGAGSIAPAPGTKVVQHASPYGWTKTVGQYGALIIHYHNHNGVTSFELFGDGAQ